MGLYFTADGKMKLGFLSLQTLMMGFAYLNSYYFSIKRISDDTMHPYLKPGSFLSSDYALIYHFNHIEKISGLRGKLVAIRDPK